MITKFDAMGRDKLEEIAKKSFSYCDFASNCNMNVSRNITKRAKSILDFYKIDCSHFRQHRPIIIRSNEEIFIKDSKSSGSLVRRRIIRDKLIQYKCALCQNEGVWLDKKLVLQVDHIDGNNKNNSLDNLRWLCPNCHSQTLTFGSKNPNRKPNNPKIRIPCLNCGGKTKGQGSLCFSCSNKLKIRVVRGKIKHPIIWPDKETLQKLVWEKPLELIAVDFNCEGTAVKKECKRKEVQTPPRGYWLRIKHGQTPEQALTKKQKPPPTAHRITDEEIAQAEKLLSDGLHMVEIATILKRDRKNLKKVMAKRGIKVGRVAEIKSESLLGPQPSVPSLH